MTPPPQFLSLEHDMNYMYINYKPIHYYTVLDKKIKTRTGLSQDWHLKILYTSQ